MQILTYVENGQICSITLPPADEEVMPGVLWGECEKVFTPSYWAYQAQRREKYIVTHKIGETIVEEIAACILGGYGIPAEVGLAAFKKLKQQQIFTNPTIRTPDIYNLLTSPIDLNGKNIKYRFAKQKSEYISEAIRYCKLRTKNFKDALEMRNWLLDIKGIGPKTASWITRNWFSSDDVAILDIHIFRAGIIAGFFSRNDCVASSYFKLEKKFLTFANSIKIKASILDAIMWEDMRIAHKTVSTHFA